MTPMDKSIPDIRRRRWTVDWVRERVSAGHHQALSVYLRNRSKEQEEEAYEAGITPYDIVRAGFNLENGQTSVPDAAMRVMRSPGVSVRLVFEICKRSTDRRCVPLFEQRLLQNIKSGEISLTPEVQGVLDELCVRVVMES